MAEFVVFVNKFLEFNQYPVIQNKGTVSKTQADEKALREYEIFNKIQKIESDFDKSMQEQAGV